MSGAVSTVGKIFNSTAGRVVTGIATGGLSEVGRAAAGTARRSGVDPAIAAGIGYATGGRASTGETLGGGTQAVSPGVPSSSINPATGGVAAASGSIQKTNEDSQRELDASLSSVPNPSDQLTALDPDSSEEASRRRARESADRAGGGKRRASQRLTTPYLGA